MKIFINNNEILFSGNTLIDLLTENGFSDSPGIAVAVNETVVSKNNWSSCILKEGDCVLIITPAQGG
jgi:sulfur carrier protein